MRSDPRIPAFLMDVLNRHFHSQAEFQLPYTYSTNAAILNTDICSFTKITERVSAHGHYGVEIMIDILNSYFSRMVECIESHGGSLIKYGGDSIFALFEGEPQISLPRCYKCSKDMYLALSELNASFESKYDIKINFDGAIGYGRISLNVVGDLEYHYDYYVDSHAVRELFILGGESPAGSIAISPHAQPFINLPVLPLSETESKPHPLISGEDFLPAQVQKKMMEKGFTAELRNTSVIFVHLCPTGDNEILTIDAYHDYFVKLQRHVYNLDGTINKIDYTDKGYLVLITFGTPYNHIDDIERALTCAYRLQKISSAQINIKIGITYSNIFAGILGSPSRHEYGIIGNAVNVAARLMANSEVGEISFSEEILSTVTARFGTTFVEETLVKGITEPLRIHKITAEFPDSWIALQTKFAPKSLVAYQNSVSEIKNRLKHGKQSLILLSGSSGTGKSFIAYKILEYAKTLTHEVDLFIMEEFNCNNQADWILRTLSHKLGIDDPARDIDILRETFGRIEAGIDFELIQRYFYSLSDTSIIAKNQAPELIPEELEICYLHLAELICALLEKVSLLLLDDIQWLDNASLQVWKKALPKLLQSQKTIILSTREDSYSFLPSGYEDLTFRIDLKNLAPSEAQHLLKKELPIASVDAQSSIYTMTKGNPLFMVEMVNTIRKHFDWENSILAESDLKRLEKEGVISDTIENLLLNEYENLDEDSQKLLRVASIIGKAFAMDEVNILSDTAFKEDFIDIISQLSKEHIIGKKTFNPGVEYVFFNQLMRDAIYRTILLSEKSILHDRIAIFYEQKYQHNIQPYVELIANHYIYAGNSSKALEFSILAGEKTSRLAAYPESNYYFEKALSLATDTKTQYQLLLAIVKNQVAIGNALQAEEMLTQIAEKYHDLLDDDFHFQMVRMIMLKASYQELYEYYHQHKNSLCNPLFRLRIKLRYLDALQFINYLDEYEEEVAKLETEIVEVDDPKLLGDYLINRALYFVHRTDYRNAADYYYELSVHAELHKDFIQLRIAHNGLGIVASRTGNKAEAREHFEKALAICEKLGDRNGYGKLTLDLATLLRNEGKLEEAIEMYKKALGTANILGNRHQQATAIYNIGEALYYEGEFARALAYFEQALDIYQKLGDSSGISYCYDAMGDINFNLENYDAALAIYTENLSRQQSLKDEEGIAHTYGNLGNIAKAHQDYPKAETYYQMQIEILERVGDVDGLGRAWFNYAMIELEQGNTEQTRVNLNKSISLFESCDAKIFADIAKEQLANLDNPNPGE